MTELTTGQLIKIIIGILVIVAVLTGAYMVFKNDIFVFFDRLPGTQPSNILLRLFK